MAGFIKCTMAVCLMALWAKFIAQIEPESTEAFIGFCILLAGMVAHSEK